MVPIHIWNNSSLVDLNKYPEHFYEHAGGRGSSYLRPVIHNRSERLNYEHLGDFSKICLSRKGETSVHIFILTHTDLLDGPSNDVLGQICELLMKIAQLSTRVIVMFIALFPFEQLTGEFLATALRSKDRAEQFISTNPAYTAWIPPQVIPPLVLSLSSPAKVDFQTLFYRELTRAVNRIIFKNNAPQLKLDQSEIQISST